MLVETLSHHFDYARRRAAEALGNIGPDASDAIPMLIELQRDRSYFVREASAAIHRRLNF